MDKLEVGYVARAHGVRGEVRVHLHHPASTALDDVGRAWFGGTERKILAARPTSGALLLTLEGVGDRAAAETLRGAAVEVLRSDLPLAEGEYFLADLPGCEVVDAAGAGLGRVVEVTHGAQDILVIHDETHERLLPAVPAFVTRVDLAARRITVDPPEDLPAEPLPARGRRKG
jgi:16S rRNA processing protein RimM